MWEPTDNKYVYAWQKKTLIRGRLISGGISNAIVVIEYWAQ